MNILPLMLVATLGLGMTQPLLAQGMPPGGGGGGGGGPKGTVKVGVMELTREAVKRSRSCRGGLWPRSRPISGRA